MPPRLDLRLPEPERRRAAGLTSAWSDFLYVPGPDFTSRLEPGLYRSSFVVVPAVGRALRVSSLVVPAFNGELCRLRIEPLQSVRPERLGSFFEPSRRGMIYALSDRRTGAARPPERPEWRYDGPALVAQLGAVTRVRLLRERVRGRAHGADFGWEADRGLALTGRDGQESLLLASADASDQALFLPALGLYRALLDPAAPGAPGASVAELLGYGDWGTPLEIEITIEPL